MCPIKNLQLLLSIKKCIGFTVLSFKKGDIGVRFNNSLLRCCTFCYIRLQKSISQSYTQGIKDVPIWPVSERDILK